MVNFDSKIGDQLVKGSVLLMQSSVLVNLGSGALGEGIEALCPFPHLVLHISSICLFLSCILLKRISDVV